MTVYFPRIQILKNVPLLTYQSPTPLSQGQGVMVPLKSRCVVGVVHDVTSEPSFQTKPLQTVLPWCLAPPFYQFLRHVSHYTLTPWGLVLNMVPQSLGKKEAKPYAALTPWPETYTLSLEQKNVLPLWHTTKPFILEGVTGSGKTEVYLHGIQAAIARGTQALVLVPEISLIPQWVQRFIQRTGQTPLVWHSQSLQKARTLATVQSLAPCVVVGTRSALFLPFTCLRCIIVDEEHDTSYKQEQGPIYHARDMAVLRAQYEKSRIALVSATPSLESLANHAQGRYDYGYLGSRYHAHTVEPEVIPWQEPCTLSPILHQAMQDTLNANLQIMLFLNRRGLAPCTLCHTCHHLLKCPGCDTYLVAYAQEYWQCNHCQYKISHCPHCHGKDVKFYGWGIEALHRHIQDTFPQAKTCVLSSDHPLTPNHVEDILSRRTQIILGTQILAKGHHFPHVTCVGILDPLQDATGGDPRTFEKIHQLWIQMMGRAGRGSHKGRVYIQTSDPDHGLFHHLSHPATFRTQELAHRKTHNLPPFRRWISIIARHKNIAHLRTWTRHMAQSFPKSLLPGAQLWGPTQAPLGKIAHTYRYRLLVNAPKDIPYTASLRQWLEPYHGHLILTIDIDPLSFL